MDRMQLKVEIRNEKGKGAGRRLRRQGAIPGILYGAGKDAVPVTVNRKALDDAFHEAGNMNVIFDLEIPGQGKVPAMVKDYQAHVLSREFLHVDFLQVDLAKKVKVEVPIHLVGKAPGVKEGGILEQITRKLEIICLPTAIPESLDVDVSTLNIGDNLHVHDIKLPEGVEIPAGVDSTIAAVVAPIVEEEKPVGAEEIKQPEVLTEKKPAEGEAAPKEEKKEKKEKK